MVIEETFMHFLLAHQQKNQRTLNFLILMESILSAARVLAQRYEQAAIQKNLDASGEQNVHGENTMQLDLLANDIVLDYLKASDQVIEVVSEELEQKVTLNPNGRYLVYFDPLDGSSNVKHSLPVGFLFGIAKRNLTGTEDYHLRKGSEFIAAGMFTLPNGIFTFALKNSGAYRFLRDTTGDYVRPKKIILPEPEKTWELSFNAGNKSYFNHKVSDWITAQETNYAFRYAGSLAVDFHRLLDNGGMYLYPAIVNHRDKNKNRPDGKLRLLYEANVVAFICKEAGGKAINELGQEILDVSPSKIHEKTALYVGSSKLISNLASILQN